MAQRFRAKEAPFAVLAQILERRIVNRTIDFLTRSSPLYSMVATRILFNLVLVTMRHKNIFPLWMERVIRTLEYAGVILGLILGRRFN